jgi:NitT/TauT family transport system substrate-binding protein
MQRTHGQTARGPALAVAGWLLAAGFLGLLSAGCGGSGSRDPNKVTVCYLGLTCEPPIFAAYEKGFFKEEGLDVELVKADWDSMREGLSLGKYDACHHLTLYLIQPIANGADIKITGGIHTGCLRLQAGVKTDIKKVEDLKGKKIGISHMGSPPHLFASRVLVAHGIDPKDKEQIEWVVFPSDTFGLALDQGRVDAVASAEPIGSILIANGKVRKIADQAIDPPYADEFCCVTAVNGKWAAAHPEQAAKVTRAMLKGAKWVAENPGAAAKLAVEKKYVSASEKINALAIAALKYEPGVAKARRDVLTVAKEMKAAGFIKKSADPEELIQRAWLDLPGVTDEWVKSIKVEKVAGGGPLPRPDAAEFALLFNRPLCCIGGGCLGCCGDLGKGLLPMEGEWALVRPTRGELLPEPGRDTAVARARP